MPGTFKRNMPYNNFLLILMGMVLYWPIMLHLRVSPADVSDGYWFSLIHSGTREASSIYLLLLKLTVMLMLIFAGILLNNIANQNRIFNKPQFLTGMSWILLTSFFVKEIMFSSILMALCILMIIFYKILKLQGQQKVKDRLFNLGIWAGISILLYSPLLFFIIWMGILMVMIRPVYFAEWLVLLLGVATPFYITAAVLFLNDQSLHVLLPVLHLHDPFHQLEFYQTINLSTVCLLGCLGLFHVQSQIRKLLVHARKTWSSLFVFFLLGFVILFFGRQTADLTYILMLVPASCCVAAFFNYVSNSKITSSVFLCMLIWSIWNAYFLR